MKPFILEFIGGCWDGMNLCNHSPDPVEVTLAEACYAETRGGATGETTVVPSDYATRQGSSRGNKYVVVHRMEFGGELLIRLELCCENPTAACPCHNKRVLFEFQGGPLHGLRLDSTSPDLNEAMLATSYFCLTEQGQMGASLGCGLPLLPSTIKQRRACPGTVDSYVVVRREEDEDEIAVALQCRKDLGEPQRKV